MFLNHLKTNFNKGPTQKIFKEKLKIHLCWFCSELSRDSKNISGLSVRRLPKWEFLFKVDKGSNETHIGALESRSSTQSVTYYFSKRLFHDLLEHKNSQFKVLKFFQPKIISSRLIVVWDSLVPFFWYAVLSDTQVLKFPRYPVPLSKWNLDRSNRVSKTDASLARKCLSDKETSMRNFD